MRLMEQAMGNASLDGNMVVGGHRGQGPTREQREALALQATQTGVPTVGRPSVDDRRRLLEAAMGEPSNSKGDLLRGLQAELDGEAPVNSRAGSYRDEE